MHLLTYLKRVSVILSYKPIVALATSSFLAFIHKELPNLGSNPAKHLNTYLSPIEISGT